MFATTVPEAESRQKEEKEKVEGKGSSDPLAFQCPQGFGTLPRKRIQVAQ